MTTNLVIKCDIKERVVLSDSQLLASVHLMIWMIWAHRHSFVLGYQSHVYSHSLLSLSFSILHLFSSIKSLRPSLLRTEECRSYWRSHGPPWLPPASLCASITSRTTRTPWSGYDGVTITVFYLVWLSSSDPSARLRCVCCRTRCCRRWWATRCGCWSVRTPPAAATPPCSSPSASPSEPCSTSSTSKTACGGSSTWYALLSVCVGITLQRLESERWGGKQGLKGNSTQKWTFMIINIVS